MTATTLPNAGMNYKWTLGEDGWNTGMDSNLLALDTLVQCSVISAAATTPPGSPTLGDSYIPATGATGAWVSLVGDIVIYDGSTWVSVVPKEGWVVYDNNTNKHLTYNGATWSGYTSENVANKSTSTSLGTSDTLYPSQNAVKSYVDTAAAAAQAAAVQRANHTGTQLAATISDFNATASAAAPVQSVNGNTGAVTVAEGDSREVRKTQAYWCEDFISYYTRMLAAPVTPTGFSSTTAEDEQQWCIGGTQDAIGVVTLIPTASTVYVTFSASSHSLAGGAGGLVLTGKTIDASWSFCQKKATASDEGFSICAGFGVAATGAWSASYPRIGFRTYDDAGVHTWEFITSTGGSSTISTITWATSGCAQNTRITCRAVITTASVLFYINGTLHATHTTNIPTTQIPDQIWHAYANLGFTDTSYGVSIDYMDKLTTLNSPRAL